MDFEQKGKDMGGKVGSEMDKMGNKMHDKSNEMGNSFGQMKEGAQNMVNDVKDKAYNMVDNVKDKACEMKEQACEYTDMVTDHVKENPMKSVGIALAFGLVIGMLLKS